MDLEQWKAECGARVPASQACNLMAGQSFYLDALEDETERRQAKEFVRSLGGHVRVLCGSTYDLGSQFPVHACDVPLMLCGSAACVCVHSQIKDALSYTQHAFTSVLW